MGVLLVLLVLLLVLLLLLLVFELILLVPCNVPGSGKIEERGLNMSNAGSAEEFTDAKRAARKAGLMV